ncbi:MAG: DUF1553 domain-containing protein [Planctomycetota bacterium]
MPRNRLSIWDGEGRRVFRRIWQGVVGSVRVDGISWVPRLSPRHVTMFRLYLVSPTITPRRSLYMMHGCVPAVAVWLGLASLLTSSANAEGVPDPVSASASAETVAFFESRIRPALIEHCAECHWSDTEASGNLLLDSRDAIREGGDLGPALIPGDPDRSLLMKVIAYEDPDLEMPPDGQLAPEVIADFRKWILDGAADPRRASASVSASEESGGLPVERAHEHWAYRPIRSNPLPTGVFNQDDSDRTASGLVRRSSSVIDAFVDTQIRQAGLKSAPTAKREAIVRRLVFDLHGLPPTDDQMEDYLSDASPLAYAKMVDRLLASPHFGEHFARRWMDVVRYAESITLRGFILPQAWRYRDYLVHAFASDRPFDQMIRDQLAGDLLPVDDLRETQRRAIATGFLALGNSNLEDQDKSKLEFDHIDEQLETIGRAFLGQTIGCARCHDHKFDPIPTRDYYALAAIMRSTTPLEHANLSKWIERPLPLDMEREGRYQDLETQLKVITAELKAIQAQDARFAKGSMTVIAVDALDGVVVDDSQATFVGQWQESTSLKQYVGKGYRHDQSSGRGDKSVTFEPELSKSGLYEVRMAYSASANRATNVRVTVFSANESKTIVVNQREQPAEEGLWVSLGVYPFEKQGQSFVIVSNEGADGYVIADAMQFRLAEEDRTAARKFASATEDTETRKRLTRTRARRDELQARQKEVQRSLDARPRYLSILEGEPKQEIAIRVRGNVHQQGEMVSRGFLTAVGRPAMFRNQIDGDASGRVQLAHWIADPQNPLTARVYANRLWSWLMGDGLVETENNFGTTGVAPSHPKLMDYLATKLIQSRWSTKRLVREIVLSQAYRRSVTHDVKLHAIDPHNRLYASGSLKRLPIESIRDAMLSVSGELDLAMGGSQIRAGTKSDYNYRHESLRRSLYLPVFRNSLPDLYETFDFADASVSVGERARSTVAPQALAMMNHPWVIQRADTAAKRFGQAAEVEGFETALDQVYTACIGRRPSQAELEACLEYMAVAHTGMSLQERFADIIQSLFASIDFRYLE